MSKDNAQNKHNKSFAEIQIGKMTDEQKKEKIEELDKIGYEYNEGIHVLMDMETIVPYDFVLYCLLIEDRDKNPDN